MWKLSQELKFWKGLCGDKETPESKEDSGLPGVARYALNGRALLLSVFHYKEEYNE
jgi:hypothetical protein